MHCKLWTTSWRTPAIAALCMTAHCTGRPAYSPADLTETAPVAKAAAVDAVDAAVALAELLGRMAPACALVAPLLLLAVLMLPHMSRRKSDSSSRPNMSSSTCRTHVPNTAACKRAAHHWAKHRDGLPSTVCMCPSMFSACRGVSATAGLCSDGRQHSPIPWSYTITASHIHALLVWLVDLQPTAKQPGTLSTQPAGQLLQDSDTL